MQSSSSADHTASIPSRSPIASYRTTAISWSSCISIVRSDSLHLLGRSLTEQDRYDSFCADLLKTWSSLSDYLLHSRFGLPFTTDDRGKRSVPATATPTRTIILLPNDFPYNFETGIGHYVLWKLGSPLSKEDILAAEQSLREQGAAEVLSYVNPAHLKSVLDIDHAHLITR